MITPKPKPVILNSTLDGTIRGLLLAFLDTLEHNTIAIHTDILQIIVMNALAERVTYEGAKELMSNYVQFE